MTEHQEDLNATASPLAALLRRYCQDHGVSMRALSKSIARGEKYVADICNGRSRNPDHNGLRALAKATGFPLLDLAETAYADPNERLAAAVRPGLYMNDVIDAVAEEPHLTAASRDKRIRNVLCFCRDWLKRDPSMIPADARWLSQTLRDREWGPAAFGVGAKRYSDVLSSVRMALETARAIPRPTKPITAVAPQWRALHTALEDSWMRAVLSPFIRYCDTLGFAPEDVTDETAEAFVAYRDQFDLSSRPLSKKLAKLRQAWNRAVREAPEWPSVQITVGARQKLTLPWQAFPRNFRDSWEAYEASRGVPGYAELESKNLLERARARRAVQSPDGRRGDISPLGDTTLHRQRESVLFVASRAVELGLVSAEEITTIADVADAQLVSHVVWEDLRPRLGLETGYADTIAKNLASVARRWVPEITPDELEDFSLLRRELDEHRETGEGLSPRDRERLAPFLHDVKAMSKLVSLPVWILNHHEGHRRRTGAVTADMAREVRAAIAMLIEQTLPVRWSDLTHTMIDVNVIAPPRAGTPGTLYYKLRKTRKRGRREQPAALAPWKMQLIETYLLHYRPQLVGDDRANPFLFPGETPGQPTTQLDKHVRRLVFGWLGHTINPHLWRKLMAGYLLLQTNEMALVEDLLGHVRGSRATQVYVEMKSSWAAARLDDHVSALVDSQPPDDVQRRLRRSER